jgi:hypothetical protein
MVEQIARSAVALSETRSSHYRTPLSCPNSALQAVRRVVGVVAYDMRAYQNPPTGCEGRPASNDFTPSNSEHASGHAISRVAPAHTVCAGERLLLGRFDPLIMVVGHLHRTVGYGRAIRQDRWPACRVHFEKAARVSRASSASFAGASPRRFIISLER